MDKNNTTITSNGQKQYNNYIEWTKTIQQLHRNTDEANIDEDYLTVYSIGDY
jgi:hypothetical protein